MSFKKCGNSAFTAATAEGESSSPAASAREWLARSELASVSVEFTHVVVAGIFSTKTLA
jgi:hypothetical protein